MAKTAQLYRMQTDKHVCPYGLKSRDLLKRQGYQVDDHLLETREQTDAFKKEHEVDTTPQTFIDDKRIGGYTDLLAFFGKEKSEDDDTSYTPVVAIFSMTALMTVALALSRQETASLYSVFITFIALSMCVLAIQKLRDLEAFSLSFVTYDLLAMRRTEYAYVYAFLEAYAGSAMLGGVNAWLVAPIALFIGGVGAVSVFKAVYIDKRELKCACVGGDSNVPLGFLSLTENVMMVVAGASMLVL